jgi:pyruvate,orthophosphate dikinase
MTYGYSRDDIGRFLPQYLESGVLPFDPFARLDDEGVGQLVKLACERGRQARPDLHLGVCGEHGGDPDSIDFFDAVGLDYVSCSPYRVPVARLAAARATLARGPAASGLPAKGAALPAGKTRRPAAAASRKAATAAGRKKTAAARTRSKAASRKEPARSRRPARAKARGPASAPSRKTAVARKAATAAGRKKTAAASRVRRQDIRKPRAARRPAARRRAPRR